MFGVCMNQTCTHCEHSKFTIEIILFVQGDATVSAGLRNNDQSFLIICTISDMCIYMCVHIYIYIYMSI